MRLTVCRHQYEAEHNLPVYKLPRYYLRVLYRFNMFAKRQMGPIGFENNGCPVQGQYNGILGT